MLFHVLCGSGVPDCDTEFFPVYRQAPDLHLPFLLLLPRHFGVTGVWLSMAGSDMLAFIVAVVTLMFMQRRINRKMNLATQMTDVAQTDDTDD